MNELQNYINIPNGNIDISNEIDVLLCFTFYVCVISLVCILVYKTINDNNDKFRF